MPELTRYPSVGFVLGSKGVRDMFPRDFRGAKITLIAGALLGLVQSFAFAQTGTIKGTITKADGSPLGYANVIIVGTTMGAMSLADGKYSITAVPPGTYTVRAMMMGYKAVEKPGVVVNIGTMFAADFGSKPPSLQDPEIVVTAERALVEVTESKTSAAVSEQQLQSMPVDDVLEAVGLKAGIVKTGDEMHVRGGRGGEVQVQIDGVPVSIRSAAELSTSACSVRRAPKSCPAAWTPSTVTRSRQSLTLPPRKVAAALAASCATLPTTSAARTRPIRTWIA
jgi:hypothetical protein